MKSGKTKKQKSKKLISRKRSTIRRSGKHDRAVKKATLRRANEDKALAAMAEEAKDEQETDFPSPAA